MWIDSARKADERRGWARHHRFFTADGVQLPTAVRRTVQPELLSPAAVTGRLRVATAHDAEMFRWAVTDHQDVILQLCGRPDVPASLDLAGHAPGNGSASILTEATRLLLPMVINTAVQEQRTEIRCLLSDELPTLSTSALGDAGFQLAASLQQWSKQVPPSIPGASNPELIPQALPAATARLSETGMLALVDSCLQDSLDLTAITAPTSQSLLQGWLRLEAARVVIARRHGRPSGIAVLHQDADSPDTTLEYLGVAVSARRLGLGRQLLDSAVSAAEGNERSPDHRRLVACCDELNTPAMNLYQDSRFARDTKHAIWIWSNISAQRSRH